MWLWAFGIGVGWIVARWYYSEVTRCALRDRDFLQELMFKRLRTRPHE